MEIRPAMGRLAATALALGCTAALLSFRAPAARAQGHEPDRPSPGATDQQRRRQAAAELRRKGFDVDWRLASWAELHDWNMRADEARLLAVHHGVRLDWRSFPLAEMKEWEARVARAAEMRRFGVDVDWRLYTMRQLDDLRAFLERTRAESPPPPRSIQESVPPEVTLGFDPDAILVPNYVTEELSREDFDDMVLEPSFAHERRRSGRRDEQPAPPLTTRTSPSIKPAPPATSAPAALTPATSPARPLPPPFDPPLPTAGDHAAAPGP
jgi:hypothetical protein